MGRELSGDNLPCEREVVAETGVFEDNLPGDNLLDGGRIVCTFVVVLTVRFSGTLVVAEEDFSPGIFSSSERTTVGIEAVSTGGELELSMRLHLARSFESAATVIFLLDDVPPA